MQHLTERDLDRLAKILGRLGSSHPGEVAAAGHKATEFIRDHGLQWQDILRVPQLATGNGSGWDRSEADDPFEAFGGWRGAVQFCLEHARELTPWERAFVAKIEGWHSISPKQRPVLSGICTKLLEAGYQP
jgi:hypothetical protein